MPLFLGGGGPWRAWGSYCMYEPSLMTLEWHIMILTRGQTHSAETYLIL